MQPPLAMGPDLARSNSVMTMLPRPVQCTADPSPLYQNCFLPLQQGASSMASHKSPPARSPNPSRASWLDCSQVDLQMDRLDVYDVPRSHDDCSPRQECVDGAASPSTSRLAHPGEQEAKKLDSTFDFLNRCLFFYPEFSMEEAVQRLAPCELGVFLLRPSSDPNFVLSLSVKTWRGTTSVRVGLKDSQFFLDSDPNMKHKLPKFSSVPRLLAFFQRLSKSAHRNHVLFLEASGRKDTPIALTRPCLRETGSLKHLCRVAVHQALDRRGARLHELPGASTRISEYLQEYPHPI